MGINRTALIMMIKELNKDCLSTRQIVEKTGLHECTVLSYLHSFRRHRLIRIAEWHRHSSGRHWVARFEWNTDNLPDAPKPKPLTKSQKTQRYRKKKLQQAAMLTN